MALTPAMEDYLEAILMIKQQHGYVRCVDVAEQLGVKKPSVSRAVKELSKSGHLVKNADGTLSLTELDTVDNSQINVLTQRTMHRICTAATNEEVSFAYRVAIPRQRFRWRNAFSTRWRSL